jgi:anti-anti-sigma regulatory factor
MEMLRITEASKDNKAVILRLDGKVVGEWVSDLQMLCLHYRDEEDKNVVLDFSGVTFIDKKGVDMLWKLKDDRIKMVNCSSFIRLLLT